MPTSRDPNVERWREDKTHIANDVVALYHARSIHRVVNKLIAENDELPPSVFFSYFHGAYAVSQAIAIRRHVDTRKGSHSLEALLDEIKRDPQRITRERYLALYDLDDVAQRTSRPPCVGHPLCRHCRRPR